jgi:hypothetical protein
MYAYVWGRGNSRTAGGWGEVSSSRGWEEADSTQGERIWSSLERQKVERGLLLLIPILCLRGYIREQQSWARAFFYASRLRFRALWQSSSRWRFRALFWALNFVLLRSRFRAPALLDFSRS